MTTESEQDKGRGLSVGVASANGAGHSRQGASGVAPCLDAGLIEEDDDVGLVQLTNLGRRALALETVAQGSSA